MTPAPSITQRLHRLAGPIILANLATPLLGMVDTAVIGQLGQTHLLGALALAAMIFNLVFWGFGFLRMGTTALVAQAKGRADPGSSQPKPTACCRVRLLALPAATTDRQPNLLNNRRQRRC